MYTKLDLVNACLNAIGNSTISTLDNVDVDTDIAMQVVKNAHIAVLSVGWWFNRETNWELIPDSNGEVKVPNTVLSMNISGYGSDIIKRQGRLYSVSKHTFDMRNVLNNGTASASYTMFIEIEDCPMAVVQYIRQKSISDMHGLPDGDINLLRMSRDRESQYAVEVEREEARHVKFNAFNMSAPQALMSSVEAGGYDNSNPLGSRE